MRLSELSACFQGIFPSILATCSADGEPNVTYLSQVHYVDDRHVALSCQFFNKTRRNVAGNPFASVVVNHPATLETWRLRLRFDHSEFEGPLFDKMALRIEVIASHSGMSGIFRLLSSDVYEVLDVERLETLLPAAGAESSPPPASVGAMTELHAVQTISERIAATCDLEELLQRALGSFDELLGFSPSMILVPDDGGERLVTLATHGYGKGGIGAEVALGGGVIGMAARRREIVRVDGMAGELSYGRAIRGRLEECGRSEALRPEIPLPGLPDAQAQLAVPLLARDRLVGVLAIESRDPLCFDEWDEAFVQILGNQIAMAVERLQSDEEDPVRAAEEPRTGCAAPDVGLPTRHFLRYRADDCVFVDGEYLTRNVPGRILWKLLTSFRDERRCEFTNRELRLDPALGLPPVKDNLEARLILLRKRLAEKCPDVRLVPVRRGRFALQADVRIELSEREHG